MGKLSFNDDAHYSLNVRKSSRHRYHCHHDRPWRTYHLHDYHYPQSEQFTNPANLHADATYLYASSAGDSHQHHIRNFPRYHYSHHDPSDQHHLGHSHYWRSSHCDNNYYDYHSQPEPQPNCLRLRPGDSHIRNRRRVPHLLRRRHDWRRAGRAFRHHEQSQFI